MKGLIVDDSIVVREDLMEIFEGTQYSVMGAADGFDAIKIFKDNQDIEIIICDYNMPHMDGLSTLDEIFKLAGERKIPSVMLTTETNKKLIQRGKEIGVRAWMTKPLNKDMLLKCLDKLLNK